MAEKGQYFKSPIYGIVGGSIFLAIGLFFVLTPAGQVVGNIGWAGSFNLPLWAIGAGVALLGAFLLVLGIRQAMLRR